MPRMLFLLGIIALSLVILLPSCGNPNQGPTSMDEVGDDLAAGKNPIVRVELYTDAGPLDSVVLHRPTWGVIKARLLHKDGSVDTKKAVRWEIRDSTVADLRQIQARSVVVQADRSHRLARTRLIAHISPSIKDTVHVQTINGIARLVVRPPSDTVVAGDTTRFCAAEETITGDFLPTAGTPTACAGVFPNPPAATQSTLRVASN